MAPKPTSNQLEWQKKEFGMFCHFGINTFYGKEWSDGTLAPAGFAPTSLDTRQWVETAQLAGMRYLIMTAKHHDGFCLWPTETTDYSVKSSAYKSGKGDIVAELAEACREADMPMGLYLSPWDRHEPCYQDPQAYDRFYVRQLTELCTRYGPLFEVWFDGAGSEGRKYDWDAIMAVVDKHQPNAMVFNMGRPTIRWVGNENGLASDPTYYAVDSTNISAFTDKKDLIEASQTQYLPPECPVAIRLNWFWQQDDLDTLKSTEHLLGIYYRSVGQGSNLLLNVPPNRQGLISQEDRQRLLEMAAELRRRFHSPIVGRCEQAGKTITVDFGKPVEFDHLILCEDLREGQHIDGYCIYAGQDKPIQKGHTIGTKKIHAFPPVRATRLRIEMNTAGARLQTVDAYRTGFEKFPEIEAGLDYEEWGKKADKLGG